MEYVANCTKVTGVCRLYIIICRCYNVLVYDNEVIMGVHLTCNMYAV